MLDSVRRKVNDEVKFVSKDQIHEIRVRLLQFICSNGMDTVLIQVICRAQSRVNAITKPFQNALAQ